MYSSFPSEETKSASLCDIPVSGSLVALSDREREVNGIVGQSALLSGSYCTPTPGSELTVEWNLHPDATALVKLIRSQCSPHPDKSGYNCSDRLIITPSHSGRVHLYPDNGSLLLWDLRFSDSGVYEISVYCGGNDSVKGNVTLTVHNGTEKANSTSPTTPQPPQSSRGFIPALPICLGVIVVVAICLSLKMARTHWERRRMRGDLMEVYKMMRGIDREDGQRLLPRAEMVATRGHRFKVLESRYSRSGVVVVSRTQQKRLPSLMEFHERSWMRTGIRIRTLTSRTPFCSFLCLTAPQQHRDMRIASFTLLHERTRIRIRTLTSCTPFCSFLCLTAQQHRDLRHALFTLLREKYGESEMPEIAVVNRTISAPYTRRKR
ncbi:uncharacterized protein [Mobula birostris]|uniref:uncharacterized protein isoform X2 n=1 Tax=Mobula birostris TaxID=1983395 RepID=UPI003B288D22